METLGGLKNREKEKNKKKKGKPKDKYLGTPPAKVLGSGGAAKTADILKNKRRQQMEELGLKDGGKVKKRVSQRFGRGSALEAPQEASKKKRH